MATKIQIPNSGNPLTVHIKKGNQCFWAANGNNTYNLNLPAGAFVEYPDGGTITAANGGNSPTVTVSPNATVGSTITVPYSQPTKAALSGSVAMQDSSSSSGQSDIIVDP